jgi:TRAP-type C4-dicarboxylate transport system permease small subunit
MKNKINWLSCGRWLHRRAENISVVLLGMMFSVFLLQIVSRYFFDKPLSWSEEVCLACWLWGVLWGSGLVLSDDEEIRLDIVYNAVPDKVRRVFKIITSAVLVLLLLISLPATWDYVTFMKVEHTASLRIPINYLYSVYIIFAVACIVRHCWMIWNAIHVASPQSKFEEETDRA